MTISNETSTHATVPEVTRRELTDGKQDPDIQVYVLPNLELSSTVPSTNATWTSQYRNDLGNTQLHYGTHKTLRQPCNTTQHVSNHPHIIHYLMETDVTRLTLTRQSDFIQDDLNTTPLPILGP